jgi:cytochrome b561
VTGARYGGVAIGLHWLVAALVLGQLALGWWMLDLPKSPPGLRAGWFNFHKSIGLTIGLLMLARLWWRARHRAPALPASVPRWQVLAARVNHAGLYACLLLMPLSGYLGSVFSGYPVKYFGLVLPQWGWASPGLKQFCSAVHYATVAVLMLLIALHVVAAFKHLLVNRDGVFARMWPRPAQPATR